MSPIKGLTDRARMPRLGKIRLGIKVKKEGTEIEYPRATDFFVLPDEPPELKKILGNKPTSIPILIPVDDLDKWASQYFRCYSRTRGLICKGDGETCQRLVDKSTGALANRESKAENITMSQMTCEGKACPEYQSEQCREVMMLQFMIPDVPGLGVWQIDTSSYNSIMNINSMDQLLRAIFGQVSMIPLTLVLEPQQVIGKDKKTKTVHCLNIRQPALTPRQAIEMKQDLMKLPAPKTTLPVADDEPPDIIEGEGQVEGDQEPEPGDLSFEPEAKTEAAVIAKALDKKEPEKAVETDGIPKTVEELFAWVNKMMKWKPSATTARSWLVNKCKIEDARIDSDPTACYHEAKALMGW